MKVRTRIAPSPTGEDIHIGNLYTAQLNWAFAKQNEGNFIIRIEDTDRERLVEGAEERILSSIKAFDLNYDEGPDNGGPFAPYRQSERLELYKKYAQELIDKGDAYYCFCSKEKIEEIKNKEGQGSKSKHLEHCDFNLEEAKKRIESGDSYVIRLKTPTDTDISFNDLIRGEIKISSNEIDDQILIKSDGFPTYHMAVVVDDHLMEISHIIRAEEWISSTPKHILLYQAFGWDLPIFVHSPILRNPDKSKLSKRKNPVWVSWYLKEGFLPEAVLNYLALMGWSHPEEKEIFSREEFVEKLDLKRISPVGPAFDLVKLEWMNGEYIRQMSDEDLVKRIEDYLGDYSHQQAVVYDYKAELPKIVPLIKERIKKLSEFKPLTDFIFEKPDYDLEVSKKLKVDNLKEILEQVLEVMEGLNKPWQAEDFEKAFRDLAEKQKIAAGTMFQVLRFALAGSLITPPLFESIKIMGEEEGLNRIKHILQTPAFDSL